MGLIDLAMTQNIDVVYSTTINQYGDEERTSKYKNVKCRWEETIRRSIINNKGEVVEYRAIAWIPAEYDDIDYDWQIEKDNKIYTIIDIRKAVSISGDIEFIRLVLR